MMVMHMGLAAFNRRRRELAAKLLQQQRLEEQEKTKPLVKGGRKNGKAAKAEAGPGD